MGGKLGICWGKMILGSTVYQGAIHQCNTGHNGRRMGKVGDMLGKDDLRVYCVPRGNTSM